MDIEQLENLPGKTADDPRPAAIKVEGLVKSYGKQVAVNNFSFEVAQGAIFGFVGPNGAGKTTTIKILATLLDPTTGTATVGGYDVTRTPAKVRDVMGYMPDFFGVYDDLTVMEYLDFYSRTQGVAGKNRAKLLNDLLDLVELGHKRDAFVDTLSRGMQQRLCLARCLVHDPQVLLLDEPASGLDPRARVEMRELLKELGKMGKTILISSHILPELAELCTDIGIVNRGKFIRSGPVNEVAQALGRKHLLRVRLLPDDSTPLRPAAQLEMAARILTLRPGLEPDTAPVIDAARAEIQAQFIGDDRQLQAVLATMMQAGLPVLHFALERSNLEDIFLEITDESDK